MPYQLRPEVDSRVFLLKLFPGTQPDVLDFIAQAGYRGLVIEAFGLGGLHYIRRNLVEKLRMLRRNGVRILVLTQCMYEKADLSIYEVGTQLLRTDVLSGMDLTTEAAVTKLMWALAQENTDELLTKNLCGEIRDEGKKQAGKRAQAGQPKKGQGTMSLAGCRDSVPAGVWGNAPTVSRATNSKEALNKGAGSEASLPVTLRSRRSAPQAALSNIYAVSRQMGATGLLDFRP